MATYRIEFRPAAFRDLEKLDKGLQRRIVARIEALAVDPFPSGIKKLQGADNLYRLRVGDYRVLYEVDAGVLLVLVVRVGPRKEIYRRLPPG